MTIINNGAVQEESILRAVNPVYYIADPDKGKPLPFAKLYYGLPGRDPRLAVNQKLVYVIQEDQSTIAVDQPIVCSAGGVPMYNGSVASIAISGSYSLAIDDQGGDQVYNFELIRQANNQGFNGIIAEEAQTVAFGNLDLTYSSIETTTASFFESAGTSPTAEFKGSYLRLDVDYEILSASEIRLKNATADGTVIIGREMDPTGQIVPVTTGASSIFVFDTIALAKVSDLQIGDTVTLNGGVASGDKLGGAKYSTVAAATGTDDNVNFIDLNNGNQLKLISNREKLAVYSEPTNAAGIGGATITVDCNKGQVHKVTLNQNVTSVVFSNVNPDTSQTTTVILKVSQDITGGRTITFPATIRWGGGTVPTITATANRHDRLVFISDDGGATWDGMVSGQDFT